MGGTFIFFKHIYICHFQIMYYFKICKLLNHFLFIIVRTWQNFTLKQNLCRPRNHKSTNTQIILHDQFAGLVRLVFYSKFINRLIKKKRCSSWKSRASWTRLATPTCAVLFGLHMKRIVTCGFYFLWNVLINLIWTVTT